MTCSPNGNQSRTHTQAHLHTHEPKLWHWKFHSDPYNDLAWLLVAARVKHVLSPEPVVASSHAPQLLLAAPVAMAASYIDKEF